MSEQELSEALAAINDATEGRMHLRRVLDAMDALPLVIPAAQEAERRRQTVEAEIVTRMAESERAHRALLDGHRAEIGKAEKEMASLSAQRDALRGELEELTVKVRALREEEARLDQARAAFKAKLSGIVN